MGVTANSWLQTSPVTLALLIGPRITLRIQVNFFHSMLVYIQFKRSFEKVYKHCFLCTLNVKIFLDIKAELSQEGILFLTQFPSLGIFTNKKSWI